MDDKIEIVKKDNDAILKKHSAIIQMRNDITANQRKLFNAILYIAGIQLIENPESVFFKARFSDIRKLSGLTHETNYKYIKDALTALQKTNIEYNVLEKDKEVEWGIFALLAEVKIKKEDEFIYFAFPPTIQENIKRPNLYALLNMGIINGLKSKYTIALYELLQDYRKIMKLQLSIEELKALMGIGDSQYKVFTMFKQKILDVAVKEINTKTDLRVSYSFGMEGRKYTSIEFRIKSVIQPELPAIKSKHAISSIHDAPLNDEALIRKLLHYGFSSKNANKYLESLSSEEINNALRLLEASMKKKSIKNPGGYLATLLNNGSLFDNVVIDSPNTIPTIKQEKETQSKSVILHKLEKDFHIVFKENQKLIVNGATDQDINAFIKENMSNSFMTEYLKKRGLILEDGSINNPAVLIDTSFATYMMDTYYLKHEEFIKFAAKSGYTVKYINGEYIIE